MLSCSATHGKLCLGAAISSLLTCVIVVLPIPYNILKFILFHVVVNGCMIWFGLKIKEIKKILKAYILLYINGFLLGGILLALQQYIKIGSLFLTTAIGGYFLTTKIWDYIKSIQRIQQYHCRVVLYMNGKTCKINGLIDTGNNLYEHLSNQPVNILDREIARVFLGEEKISQMIYIPYRSVGKQDGVLLALKIDQMHISGEKECWIREPLLGISDNKISVGGEYQIIIHPDLF